MPTNRKSRAKKPCNLIAALETKEPEASIAGPGWVSSTAVTTPIPPIMSGRFAAEVSPHNPSSGNASVGALSRSDSNHQSWLLSVVSRQTVAAYNGAALRRSTTR